MYIYIYMYKMAWDQMKTNKFRIRTHTLQAYQNLFNGPTKKNSNFPAIHSKRTYKQINIWCCILMRLFIFRIVQLQLLFFFLIWFICCGLRNRTSSYGLRALISPQHIYKPASTRCFSWTRFHHIFRSSPRPPFHDYTSWQDARAANLKRRNFDILLSFDVPYDYSRMCPLSNRMALASEQGQA